MRVTVACPESLTDDANQLAMCLAFSEADGQTYRNLNWTDGKTLYAAASFEARDEWVTAAQSPLTRPAWDVGEVIDLNAAKRAQAVLVFSLEPVAASPTAITAIGGIDGPEALASMGLQPLDLEPVDPA